MTPKGQMAFGGGPPITHLPPPMKAMFQPGPPLEFKKKVAKRRNRPYTGMAQYVALFETDAPAPRQKFTTPKENKANRRAAAMAANDAKMEAEAAAWDPNNPADPDKVTSDAYKARDPATSGTRVQRAGVGSGGVTPLRRSLNSCLRNPRRPYSSGG